MSPDKYVNATRLIGVLESVLEDEEKKEASLEKMAMVSSLRCAIRLLSEEVAADVEPVIHCKDCAACSPVCHWRTGELTYYLCNRTDFVVSADGFCNFGRRRTNNG